MFGTVYPFGWNKRFSSRICVDSWVRQETHEESRRTYKPNHFEYNNKSKVGDCSRGQLEGSLYFDPRPSPKVLFQGDTPEGSDTFQWPVIERDRVSGLGLMIWDKVKVPLCHYSDAPEESNLCTAWQLFPLDDD